jgi:hypothetical protein
VFVFYGAATWAADLSTTADADVILLGEKTDGHFGAQNGERRFRRATGSQMLVRRRTATNIDAERQGQVYGSGRRLAARSISAGGGRRHIEIVVIGTAQRLGQGLALGEMNGDGYPDLAVGARVDAAVRATRNFSGRLRGPGVR